MDNRYIAFDVETPNAANDRISAIGITVVENGAVAGSYASLVNPQARFDRFNVALTGITPEMAASQPAFDQLWETIRPILDSGLLVAHNAPFDLAVLGKCLRDYGISWHPTAQYACTCQMSRRLMPQLCNHKLNTLCDYLGLQLDHHRADSDSRACGEILLHHLHSGASLAPFIRTYDFVHLCTLRSPRRT